MDNINSKYSKNSIYIYKIWRKWGLWRKIFNNKQEFQVLKVFYNSFIGTNKNLIYEKLRKKMAKIYFFNTA